MPPKNYFQPETLKRIARLDLRARYVVEGFLSGMHKSRHFGNSVEFRQHRQYVAGDDPKNVDWKVWAKQDRLYVKQYEVDTNFRLTLLLDISRSMSYGFGAMNKYDYACTMAASLAYLAIRQQDAVGCITFDKDAESMLPSRMKRSQLNALVGTMQKSDPAPTETKKTSRGWFGSANPARKEEHHALNRILSEWKEHQPSLRDALREAAEVIPGQGVIVLISDLFVQREGLFAGLRHLLGRGHEVVVMQVMDDDELDFELAGPTRFEGLESIGDIRCDPRMLRKGYLDAVAAYLEELRKGCSQNRVDYTLFRTSDPLDAALSAFLSRPRRRIK